MNLDSFGKIGGTSGGEGFGGGSMEPCQKGNRVGL